MAEPSVSSPHAFHISSGSNLPVTRIVIHDTESAGSGPGTAHGVLGYFSQPSSGGSAHYITDVRDEFHPLGDSEIGWHAPPNQGSIGIEICGQARYSRATWLSADVWPAVLRAAQRTAELCARFGVPMVRLSSTDLLNGRHGICGHVDVSQAWHQSDHSDPGPNFPWDAFMAAVTAAAGVRAPAAASGFGSPLPPSAPNLAYVVCGVQRAPSNPGFTAYLQRRLGIPADGSWGPQTTRTLAAFQRAHGLAGDAVIGAATAAALGWAFRP